MVIAYVCVYEFIVLLQQCSYILAGKNIIANDGSVHGMKVCKNRLVLHKMPGKEAEY